MHYQIFLFSRKDLRIILLGTALGGFLQVLSIQYLKTHPEVGTPELVTNDTSENKDKNTDTSENEKVERRKPGLHPFFLGTVIGGFLQVLCFQYLKKLKKHPELVTNDTSENKDKNMDTSENKKVERRKPGFRGILPSLPRGGAIFEIIGAKIVINAAPVIIFVAKKGTLTVGLLTATGLIAKNIPMKAVSTAVSNALPATEKGYVLVKGKKILLDQCDHDLDFLFKMLMDEGIPFEEKKQKSLKILMDHLNLKTTSGRLRAIACIITILYIFSRQDNMTSYFLMMGNLLKALKEGKISKRLARLLIRKLRKLNLPIDPELMEAAGYSIRVG